MNSMPGYWVSDCYTNNPMWNVKELEENGRPGVKVTEKEKKVFPPSEELKIIPMDWNKETTVEIAHSTKEWAKKIGIAY